MLVVFFLSDLPLGVDVDLWLEGCYGLFVCSLASYWGYYLRWSMVWEVQVLFRAWFAAGDVDLGIRFIALIDPVCYPAGGLTVTDVVEIWWFKGRVDVERLFCGVDLMMHIKLGCGGLVDVEWMIQLLQLGYGYEVVGLCTTCILDVLSAAAGVGLLS